MNIREVEITFYHPDTTLSRVLVYILFAPGMNSAYLCINRKDNGEIRILHDYLMDHGAKENFMGVMKAGMAQHTSDLQKKQEEKALYKQQKAEEKKQLKIERGKQAAIRLEHRESDLDVQKRKKRNINVLFAVLVCILTVWTRRKISTMHFLCLHMLSII